MPVPRYRCAACGNVTRFDVTTTRTTRAFHHFTVGGALTLEEEEVLEESVDEVACRWCGHGRAVEVVAGDAPSPTDGAGASGVPAPSGGPGAPAFPAASG